MNAVLEPTILQTVIEQATPAQRRYLVEKLLARDAQESRFLPILVQNDQGENIGYYMPRFHPKSRGVPRFSEKQVAEFERRLKSLDNTITHEELLSSLGLPDVRLKRL